MKCIILAGGRGNSLWPLSRENYPKQFMDIKNNRSLFQESIARNIPFCDEFIISTNVAYHFIVENQMKDFQGLRYRCFLEEERKKTAPAIAMICMCFSPSELVFVVSSDQIIEGENYKDTIIHAQELARDGAIVTFGMNPEGPRTDYGYIEYEGNHVLSFKEKPGLEEAEKYIADGGYLWNSGNFLFRAGDFLQELKAMAPEVYHSCYNSMQHMDVSSQDILLQKYFTKDIPAISVEHAVLEKSDLVRVVKSDVLWYDVGDLNRLSDYAKAGDDAGVIEKSCQDVTVINRTGDRLVVVNGLEDALVVNTEDAVYVGKKSVESDIKEIVREYHGKYGEYFENHHIYYRAWGTHEVLEDTPYCKVRKVTLYPGKTHRLHKHDLRSEQWTVVHGTATITLGRETKEYRTKDSVYIPIGVEHSISNFEDEELVIIEVAIGEKFSEDDSVTIAQKTRPMHHGSSIIKLEPAFKDYLWGGTKLKDIYHKKCDYDIVAESWELSAHKDGQSIVGSGRFKGMLFGDYLKRIGPDALGWKSQAFERFPILVKIIDAKQSLSIQVHPDDEFALREENEYGKNEMWHIMDCEEGAFIYYGVNQPLTKDELKKRVEDNTVLEVLNKIEVHKGDTFFVDAGTIHAIGAGILLCEIQQNSNCTYRLYDYDRRDKYGHPRELHLEKAREVSTLEARNVEVMDSEQQITVCNGYEEEVLGSCKYFESKRYQVYTEVEFNMNDASFCSIIIIEGEGMIRCDDESFKFTAADSFFIPAGQRKVLVRGKCSFIKTHV
ncbi:MAG: cupin domain-containing protein [Clostridia bacterium]|nr:sugar phosphate nucleotidyltransferase [Lachnospiraceae bacterium]NCC01313.1 cupin domain-containing protein [Clostridia bacterium]NCD03160.1 cupin domain-containing protein [Clostridia bacterium]